MEDHQSKLTVPEHLELKMNVLEDDKCSTFLVGPLPGSARRLGANSQRPNEDLGGQVVVGNLPVIQDKGEEARHDIDIRSGTYYPYTNLSSGTSFSGHSISQEKTTLFFPRNVLDTQVGGEDTHYSRTIPDESYFLKRHEIQFKNCSDGDEKLFDSTRGESAHAIQRDILYAQAERKGNKYDDETTGDESYFLSPHAFQFGSISE